MGIFAYFGIQDTEFIFSNRIPPLFWHIFFREKDYNFSYSRGKKIFENASVNTQVALKRYSSLMRVARHSRLAWKFFYPSQFLLDWVDQYDEELKFEFYELVHIGIGSIFDMGLSNVYGSEFPNTSELLNELRELNTNDSKIIDEKLLEILGKLYREEDLNTILRYLNSSVGIEKNSEISSMLIGEFEEIDNGYYWTIPDYYLSTHPKHFQESISKLDLPYDLEELLIQWKNRNYQNLNSYPPSFLGISGEITINIQNKGKKIDSIDLEEEYIKSDGTKIDASEVVVSVNKYWEKWGRINYEETAEEIITEEKVIEEIEFPELVMVTNNELDNLDYEEYNNYLLKKIKNKDDLLSLFASLYKHDRSKYMKFLYENLHNSSLQIPERKFLTSEFIRYSSDEELDEYMVYLKKHNCEICNMNMSKSIILNKRYLVKNIDKIHSISEEPAFIFSFLEINFGTVEIYPDTKMYSELSKTTIEIFDPTADDLTQFKRIFDITRFSPYNIEAAQQYLPKIIKEGIIEEQYEFLLFSCLDASNYANFLNPLVIFNTSWQLRMLVADLISYRIKKFNFNDQEFLITHYHKVIMDLKKVDKENRFLDNYYYRFFSSYSLINSKSQFDLYIKLTEDICTVLDQSDLINLISPISIIKDDKFWKSLNNDTDNLIQIHSLYSPINNIIQDEYIENNIVSIMNRLSFAPFDDVYDKLVYLLDSGFELPPQFAIKPIFSVRINKKLIEQSSINTRKFIPKSWINYSINDMNEIITIYEKLDSIDKNNIFHILKLIDQYLSIETIHILSTISSRDDAFTYETQIIHILHHWLLDDDNVFVQRFITLNPDILKNEIIEKYMIEISREDHFTAQIFPLVMLEGGSDKLRGHLTSLSLVYEESFKEVKVAHLVLSPYLSDEYRLSIYNNLKYLLDWYGKLGGGAFSRTTSLSRRQPGRFKEEISLLNFVLLHVGSSLAAIEANKRYFSGKRSEFESRVYTEIDDKNILKLMY